MTSSAVRWSAFFMCPGHERWHPAPGFYYLRGGGPMLDMGPYYITDLVQLLGPVALQRGGQGDGRGGKTKCDQGAASDHLVDAGGS